MVAVLQIQALGGRVGPPSAVMREQVSKRAGRGTDWGPFNRTEAVAGLPAFSVL